MQTNKRCLALVRSFEAWAYVCYRLPNRLTSTVGIATTLNVVRGGHALRVRLGVPAYCNKSTVRNPAQLDAAEAEPFPDLECAPSAA
jgi:hypothetical protein